MTIQYSRAPQLEQFTIASDLRRDGSGINLVDLPSESTVKRHTAVLHSNPELQLAGMHTCNGAANETAGIFWVWDIMGLGDTAACSGFLPWRRLVDSTNALGVNNGIHDLCRMGHVI